VNPLGYGFTMDEEIQRLFIKDAFFFSISKTAG